MLKRVARRWLVRVLRPLGSVLDDVLVAHHEKKNAAYLRRMRGSLQSCGAGTRFNGTVRITGPESCVIGNNVHIGTGAFIRAEGGLCIGDNTHISRNLTVCTLNHDYNGTALPYDAGVVRKPVLIGCNVWIGMNVSIVPGVVIGEGAVVGMGSVVTSDVPQGAVVGGAPAVVLKRRDMAHYERLDRARCYGGVDGHVGEGSPPPAAPHAVELGANLFFVLTTGRSGSTSIAHALDRHPQIGCTHEPRQQMIRLSTEFAHGQKTRAEVARELNAIFNEASIFAPGMVVGESDQKYFNLVPILHELLPEARFIWLVRDPRDAVASTEARGWFRDDEYDPNARPGMTKLWQQYRLDGARCGSVTPDQWHRMSVFERNCWYWWFVNEHIEQGLMGVPGEQWLRATLDELSTDLSGIWRFLGVSEANIQLPQANPRRSQDQSRPIDQWDAARWEAFQRWCGEGMERWIPGQPPQERNAVRGS